MTSYQWVVAFVVLSMQILFNFQHRTTWPWLPKSASHEKYLSSYCKNEIMWVILRNNIVNAWLWSLPSKQLHERILWMVVARRRRWVAISSWLLCGKLWECQLWTSIAWSVGQFHMPAFLGTGLILLFCRQPVFESVFLHLYVELTTPPLWRLRSAWQCRLLF